MFELETKTSKLSRVILSIVDPLLFNNSTIGFHFLSRS